MSDRIRTIDELVNDPLIRVVMASDGVTAEEIRALFRQARERGAEETPIPPAHVIDACRSNCIGL